MAASRPWIRRKKLFDVAQSVLGHDDEQRELYLEIEQRADKLWELGERNYEWYNSPLYVYNCVNCFCDFSKGYTRYFARWINEEMKFYERPLHEVLDYGCGIGASSRLLREEADVGVLAHFYGHSHSSCLQAMVGLQVLNPVDHAETIVTPGVTQELDRLHWNGVMAFELFEHEMYPLQVFDELTADRECWVVAESSSFGTAEKFGHHPVYYVDVDEVPRKQMAKRWKRELAERGWKLSAQGWNGRPHVWVRV